MRRKEIRQKELMTYILQQGCIPKNNRKLAKKFHVSVRTIQKDLNEICPNLTKIVLEQSKMKLTFIIKDRMPDMKNADLIRLRESFFPKKHHVKVAEETQIVVKTWNWSHEREKSD